MDSVTDELMDARTELADHVVELNAVKKRTGELESGIVEKDAEIAELRQLVRISFSIR